MRVKKIDIFGFKSFASRQHVTFGEGVTCVVGPNGCGKSNVVDALRWVMGEQNARHLRGGNMQDIIFCGSEKKAPLGFAEVTLTLENKDQSAPIEYNHFQEIAITRRLYKTGESDYEINRQKARLKDISEFFLGTGVGTKAYSIIEQGRVNEVISAKAVDRRLIIEEAAGITKYKAKKAAAERRIESTKINLDRIIDIKNEIDKRVKILAREKEKLDQVNLLKNKLRDLDLHTASHNFLEFYTRQEYLNRLWQKLKNDAVNFDSQLSELEKSFSASLESFTKKGEQVRLLGSLSTQHTNSIELLKKDLEHINVTAADNKNFILRLDTQIADITQRKNEIDNESKNIANNLKDVLKYRESIDAEILNKKNSGEKVIKKRQENIDHEKTLHNIMIEAATNATRLQTLISSLMTQDKQKQEEIKTINADLNHKNQEIEVLAERLTIIKAEYDNSNTRSKNLHEKLEKIETILDSKENESIKLKKSIGSLDEERLRLSSRLNSLEEIDSHREWSESGIHILQNSEAKSLVQGIVADAIVVEAGHEELIEKCLIHILDTGIINSSSDLKKISDILKQTNLASTSFYLLNENDNPINSSSLIGLKSLSEHIKIKDEKLINLNRKLKRYFVADSLKSALDHWPAARLCNATIVTETEEMLLPDGRAVLLGTNSNKGILQRKSEISSLKQNVQKKSNTLNEHVKNLEILNADIRSLKHTKTQLDIELVPIDSGLIRLDEIIKQKDQDLKRSLIELDKQRETLKNIQSNIYNNEEKIKELNKQWSDSLLVHRENEEKIEEVTASRAAVDKEYEKYQQELREMEINRASVQEKSNSLKLSLDNAQKNLSLLESQQEAFSGQVQDKSGEAETLAEKKGQTYIALKNLEEELLSTNKLLEEAAAECSTLRDKKLHLEGQLAKIKNALQETQMKLHDSEIQINNVNNNIEKICERVFEKYQLVLSDQLHDYHHIPIDQSQAKIQIDDFKNSLEKMGGVNENSAKEYDEFNERKKFLENQIDDLQDALVQLESAIKKINKTTKVRFLESFNKINKQFSLVFPRLFNGGKAELILTDEEDLLNCGVDIVARPPGKNIGSIELMSGGEKALTAISLIMAIFLIKPSPFCLLDEVDAPLDEANVSRFSQLIKEMSSLSQFIVITHNRKTMEIADQLYGVTMEDAGSSKIVSVQVQEAFEMFSKKTAKSGIKNKPTQLFLDDMVS